MELRSLTRCLRSRPTTCLLYTQPAIRSLSNPQSLRFSSTDNSPSPHHPSQSNTRSRPQKPRPPRPSTNTTAGIDQILNELNFNSRDNTKAPAGTTPGFPEGNRRNGPNGLSLSRAVGLSGTTESMMRSPRKVELKLGPTLGRQVHVEPERGLDLAAALRSLGAACSANRVRQQSNQQKFHVRRGQMKKNLRMERWRKLFKFSFTHTVNKIQRMRAQGW